MTPSIVRKGTFALTALALALPAGASPLAGRAVTHPQACNGFLKRLFHPKIDLGHNIRALTYPVKKAVGNGGKAVVDGGKAAAGAAASYYISSKKPGIQTILPKK